MDSKGRKVIVCDNGTGVSLKIENTILSIFILIFCIHYRKLSFLTYAQDNNSFYM